METQIVIFLALLGIVTTTNALMLWFAYREFAKIAGKVSDGMRNVQANRAVAEWVQELEASTAKIATVTEAATRRLEGIDPAFDRAQSVFEFGLAKVDVRFERICESVSRQAARIQEAISSPAHRIGEVTSGIQNVLEVIAVSENGADASSTRKQ